MSRLFIGKLNENVSSEGKKFYKGWCSNVPVLGFFDTKDPKVLHIKVDAGMVDYIQKENKKPVDGSPDEVVVSKDK